MYGSDPLGFQVSASLFLGEEIMLNSLGGARRIGYEGSRMSQAGRRGERRDNVLKYPNISLLISSYYSLPSFPIPSFFTLPQFSLLKFDQDSRKNSSIFL